mmetsp:Transcript_35221/g.92147  ORF Transcript_35221/g.92147 Transcript_35221/m.92147 type:complete len:346 (-) Transcript_35221:277-1314(-)
MRMQKTRDFTPPAAKRCHQKHAVRDRFGPRDADDAVERATWDHSGPWSEAFHDGVVRDRLSVLARITDRIEKNNLLNARGVLLVYSHLFKHLLRVGLGGHCGGQLVRCKNRLKSAERIRRELAEPTGQLGLLHHSDSNALSMEELWGHDGLNGVADRVAVVQDCAETLLFVVLQHDLHLDLHRLSDDRRKRSFILRQDPFGHVLKLAEKRRRVDCAGLDDLGQTCPHLAVIQRPQEGNVGVHPNRIVKGSDEVLARRNVDPGLTTNARVHHRKQRRWNLSKLDAAHVGCRHKAGEIADNATTERNNDRPAIIAVSAHEVFYLGLCGSTLALLPRGHCVVHHLGRG